MVDKPLHPITPQQERRSLPQGEMSSESLDFLLQQSQLLWRESSYEKLIAKFAEIQKDYFGLRQADLFAIRTGATTPLHLVSMAFDLRGAPSFAADFANALEATLATLNLKSPEFRLGLNHIHCAGEEVYFVLLGDPAADWQILVWQITPEQPSGEAQTAYLYNEFLVRQLQGSCIWFRRLDKTQALLYRDDLTGVFNSRYLDIAIDSEIRRGQRFQTSFCLLFVDLDNFKMVNDKFGHLAGSSVLRQLADVLKEASREVDSVIRYGGDEFVILLLGATPSTGVLAAERMRRKIEETRFMLDEGNHVSLTASIGVAAYPDHTTDKSVLLKLADEMMYASKREGKNRVSLFKPSEKTHALENPTDVVGK